MKHPVFFCFTLCSILTCSAQKLKQDYFFLKRGLIDVQSGLSMPVGDFALSNLTLPAGYAQNGYHVKAGLNYDVIPHLGFALQYQYTENPFNSNKFLSDIRAAYPGYSVQFI